MGVVTQTAVVSTGNGGIVPYIYIQKNNIFFKIILKEDLDGDPILGKCAIK